MAQEPNSYPDCFILDVPISHTIGQAHAR